MALEQISESVSLDVDAIVRRLQMVQGEAVDNELRVLAGLAVTVIRAQQLRLASVKLATMPREKEFHGTVRCAKCGHHADVRIVEAGAARLVGSGG
jgi:hypothetical protein